MTTKSVFDGYAKQMLKSNLYSISINPPFAFCFVPNPCKFETYCFAATLGQISYSLIV